jgi:hypothetical protein
MKSNHSCRRCRRWFEGEWNQTTSKDIDDEHENGECFAVIHEEA